MKTDPETIEKVFSLGPEKLGRLKEIARGLADTIQEADPVIQEHTEAVCPSCRSVCCINRHSFCEYEDVVYLRATGQAVIPDASGRKDDDPCRFLGSRGCTIARPLRPYRCTWYFCAPLMEHLQNLPSRQYRRFLNLLNLMTEKRFSLAEEFLRIAGSLPSLETQ